MRNSVPSKMRSL